jgi:hypothetical protein
MSPQAPKWKRRRRSAKTPSSRRSATLWLCCACLGSDTTLIASQRHCSSGEWRHSSPLFVSGADRPFFSEQFDAGHRERRGIGSHCVQTSCESRPLSCCTLSFDFSLCLSLSISLSLCLYLTLISLCLSTSRLIPSSPPRLWSSMTSRMSPPTWCTRPMWRPSIDKTSGSTRD